MYCSKCGTKISDEVKFCPKCGKRTTTADVKMTTDAVEANNDSTVFSDTENVNYSEKTSFFQSFKRKIGEFWNKLSRYERMITICILVCSLFCLIAFCGGKVFAGIISLVQIALFVVALLIKKQIIKTPKRWTSILSLVLAFSLIVPYIALFSGNSDNIEDDYEQEVFEPKSYSVTDNLAKKDEEKPDWADLLLIKCVPQPQSDEYTILDNTYDNLSVYVYEISKSDFSDYVKACEKAGFNVETEKSEKSFFAYNQDGYKLDLDYKASIEEMHIEVEAPAKMSELEWTDLYINNVIPAPKSNIGIIEQDDEEGLVAYVGETSIEDYNKYVDECINSGFNIDSEKTKKSFNAKNSEDYSLTVDYKGNSVIYIDLYVPEYTIDIEVNCIENLIFSKYDVEVYVDDEKQVTIEHGKSDTFTVVLRKGIHTIKCNKLYSDSVNGEVEFEVSKDDTIKIKLYCTSDEIDVENLSETDPTETSETEEIETEPEVESSNKSGSSKTNSYKNDTSEQSSKISNEDNNYDNDRSNDIVYITATGSKYHRSYCRTVKGGSTEITRGDAEAQGYDACKVCNP